MVLVNFLGNPGPDISIHKVQQGSQARTGAVSVRGREETSRATAQGSTFYFQNILSNASAEPQKKKKNLLASIKIIAVPYT